MPVHIDILFLLFKPQYKFRPVPWEICRNLLLNNTSTQLNLSSYENYSVEREEIAPLSSSVIGFTHCGGGCANSFAAGLSTKVDLPTNCCTFAFDPLSASVEISYSILFPCPRAEIAVYKSDFR